MNSFKSSENSAKSLSEIKVFSSPEFGSVRTMLIDGEPFFVGKDVATILGYKDTADAVKVHVDEDDKGVGELPTPWRQAESCHYQ